MRQIIDEIRNNGVREDYIVYINFEDYKYRKISNADALYEYIEAKIKDEKNLRAGGISFDGRICCRA